MYDKRNRDNMKRIHFMCLEDMVPKNHLLRAIEKAMDWNFIYEEVKGLYAEERWGKPGIDPVSLIKIVMIQYIYGIPSMRQTMVKVKCSKYQRTANSRSLPTESRITAVLILKNNWLPKAIKEQKNYAKANTKP